MRIWEALGWCEIAVTLAVDGETTLLHVLPWRSSSGFTLLNGVGNIDVQLNYSRAYDTIEGIWGSVAFVSIRIYDGALTSFINQKLAVIVNHRIYESFDTRSNSRIFLY
jgi:hypothetical protein